MSARLGVAVALVLAVVGVAIGATTAAAQATSQVEWSMANVGGPVRRLYTPKSGAFFAQTTDGLARSDDGGATWRAVELPAPPVDVPGAIVVDPTNHATIYLAAADGLYKTADDGRSWRLLAPIDLKKSRFQALAVSPVDPNVVYFTVTTDSHETISFKRSADGGETWDEPDSSLVRTPGSPGMPCYWIVYLLQPHPTEPNGLYRAFACESRGIFVTLRRSLDGGANWQILIQPPLVAPGWLVGGQADAAGRLIFGANSGGHTFGGYIISRSDDDGATWQTIDEYKEGGQVNRGPNVSIGGLAIDPTRSDRLLLGLNASGRPRTASTPAPLRLSDDGGATWTDVTPPDLGKINDVKFGIDGGTMFVATDDGVWRAARSQ